MSHDDVIAELEILEYAARLARDRGFDLKAERRLQALEAAIESICRLKGLEK